MQTRPMYRVGVAGLDPRDWRLVEIVFKHSQYNRYEFRLAQAVKPDSIDILIANPVDTAGVQAIAQVRASSVPIPILEAMPRGEASAARYALTTDRLTLQLLPLLNRIVDEELLSAAANEAQPAAVPPGTAPVSRAPVSPPVPERTEAVLAPVLSPAQTIVQRESSPPTLAERIRPPAPARVELAPAVEASTPSTGPGRSGLPLPGRPMTVALRPSIDAFDPTADQPDLHQPEPPEESTSAREAWRRQADAMPARPVAAPTAQVAAAPLPGRTVTRVVESRPAGPRPLAALLRAASPDTVVDATADLATPAERLRIRPVDEPVAPPSKPSAEPAPAAEGLQAGRPAPAASPLRTVEDRLRSVMPGLPRRASASGTGDDAKTDVDRHAASRAAGTDLPTTFEPTAPMPEAAPTLPAAPRSTVTIDSPATAKAPPEPARSRPASPPAPASAEPARPRSAGSNRPTAPAADTARTRTDSPQRLQVLVVDDSPTVRQQLSVAFERMGMRCLAVDSAALALQRLADQPVDLVLADVVMPDMDGYKLTREIKRNRQTRQIPVIILTSKSSPFDLARGALAGCDSYLSKPVPMRALEAAVVKQLRKSLAIDDLSALLKTSDGARASENVAATANESRKKALSPWWTKSGS